ncbi:uncharacterized protein LOC126904387 [Daktulosphaira vitifoliae]|uniref:uncharacterized protein LOC126904387 n=1 Tax=Daktulosphaira vitifoliae TaxID=58002 RepID=UPI0021AA5727|nr:uncharacterized protein LOC126904387 [Daktulosphaira vitifoliae]
MKIIYMLITFGYFQCVSKTQALYIYRLVKVISCMKDRHVVLVDANFNNSSPYINETNRFIVYKDITPTMNITIKPAVYMKKKENWDYLRTLSEKTVDLCKFLKQDIAILPIIQKFVSLPKECPMEKSDQIITKSQVPPMLRPLVPIGCWKLKFEFFDTKKILVGCINVITLQSSVSELASNEKTCN